VRRSKKSANPFYVLLVLAGLVFAITATAYGVMAFREARPKNAAASADAHLAENGEHPLMTWMNQHGERALLTELALLALCTFAAIGTDSYWQRRANMRRST
jgi:hypothetical protein